MKYLEDSATEAVDEAYRARAKWGLKFDAANTLNDWITYTVSYMSRASRMDNTREQVIEDLRKAAGLALNALNAAENDKLAPRHYDL
jgi:ABC-type phosphate transport system ATPase subunit